MTLQSAFVLLILLLLLSTVSHTTLLDGSEDPLIIYVEDRLPDENANGVIMGIDVPKPRISYSFPLNVFAHQKSHRIYLYNLLGNAEVWFINELEPSNLNIQIEKELDSNTRYFVTVEVVESNGNIYNGRVDFHTSLLKEEEKIGKWIGHNELPLNQFKKDFEVKDKKIIQATAFISGIGYYELYLNGENVDPTRKLDPGWTTYEKRTLYSTFDVLNYLNERKNRIGVLLGNGWFGSDQSIPPAVNQVYNSPRLWFQLNILYEDYTTEKIISDKSWYGRRGFILLDSVYHGETIDARLMNEDWAEHTEKRKDWVSVEELPSHLSQIGVLSSQIMEPIRTNGEIYPINIWRPSLNTWIVDFGQNMAGWVRFSLAGPRGVSVRIRYGEILEHQSSLIFERIYIDNLRAASQTDTYILKGSKGGETFEPRFTVHGFRYVEVTSSWSEILNHIVAIPVYSDAPPVGKFKTSNSVLNQIQHNIIWSQKSNLMSIPTDCPQRDERNGWMGDASLTVDEALFNFYLAPFFQNWVQNIKDIQSEDGSVSDTVPFFFGEKIADPSWGSAYPTCIYALYDHYGSLNIVQEHYNNLKKWVKFLEKKKVDTGIGKMYFNYGDWVPPPPHPKTNQSLVSAASFIIDLSNFVYLAELLQKDTDVQEFSDLLKDMKKEFHEVFYDESLNGYANNTQTANVLALAIDAVPEDKKEIVLLTLLDDIYKNNFHSTCGIIGFKYLFPILSKFGYHDIALKIATQTTYPSLGYMFNNPYENATTLWEIFDAPFKGGDMNSRNHIMFGSIGSWFYRYIGGIKPNALKDLEISPSPVSADSPVNSASVSYKSINGIIGVNWKKGDNFYGMNVIIPSSTTARVIIPKHNAGPYTRLMRDGKTIVLKKDDHPTLLLPDEELKKSGIISLEETDDGSFKLQLDPGRYQFFLEVKN